MLIYTELRRFLRLLFRISPYGQMMMNSNIPLLEATHIAVIFSCHK